MSEEAEDAMAKLLEEWFPDLSPNERFAEWQEMNLEAIEAGWLAALVQKDGAVLFKHIEHCSDDELRRKLTPAQYRNMMHR